jgi:hypothetical protein
LVGQRPSVISYSGGYPSNSLRSVSNRSSVLSLPTVSTSTGQQGHSLRMFSLAGADDSRAGRDEPIVRKRLGEAGTYIRIRRSPGRRCATNEQARDHNSACPYPMHQLTWLCSPPGPTNHVQSLSCCGAFFRGRDITQRKDANEALLPIENREPAHRNVPHVARHVLDVLILI